MSTGEAQDGNEKKKKKQNRCIFALNQGIISNRLHKKWTSQSLLPIISKEKKSRKKKSSHVHTYGAILRAESASVGVCLKRA
jgi:hypothetical protein